VNADKAILMAAFARIDPVALALGMGCVSALALFLMTAILVVKGAPPGVPVGAHLGALEAYFPGYSVSWPGAAIGAAYAGATGAAIGFLFSVLWNLSHILYIILVVLRASWWRMTAN